MSDATLLRRNLEIKARIHSLSIARQSAQAVCTACLGAQRQTDTYFRCPQGRLKLREIEPAGGDAPVQLIWYFRRDQQGCKQSEYCLVAVADAASVKGALTAALGVRQVVVKQREVFLHENVRIHLDQVVGLGKFLELEAVLSTAADERESPARVARLQRHFGILPQDLLRESYVDLLSQGG